MMRAFILLSEIIFAEPGKRATHSRRTIQVHIREGSHAFHMHNTTPYTDRIKQIALERGGVVLTDEEAYEALARLTPLVKVVYQPKPKISYGRRGGGSETSSHT